MIDPGAFHSFGSIACIADQFSSMTFTAANNVISQNIPSNLPYQLH
jgi:hypothetical protein